MLSNRNSNKKKVQAKYKVKTENGKMRKPSPQKKTRLLPSRYVPIYPKNYEREYFRILRALVRKLKEATKSKMYSIKNKLNQRNDDDIDDLIAEGSWSDEILKEIINAFDDSGVRDKVNKEILKVLRGADQLAKENLRKSLEKAVGVDIFINDTDLLRTVEAEWYSTQSKLADSIVSQYTDKLQTIISEGVQFGYTYDDIAEDIEKLYNTTEDRAKFIARNEISNFNAGVTRQRMQDCGIEVYEWSTSKDERVRDSHKEREGKYFYWNKKEDGEINGIPVYATPDYNPGEDYNCRCVAIAVVDLSTWNMENATPIDIDSLDLGNVG